MSLEVPTRPLANSEARIVTTPSPWDWMGPAETAILGDVVRDPAEQARWCRAILFGSLPYMWRTKATVVRDLAYEKLDLRKGDRVLIIGECIEVCGFTSDIRDRIGDEGEMEVIDITDEARGAYVTGIRGRHGDLATWEWAYTKRFPDGHFDAVAILQAVQHTDDWRESALELTRILKPGRSIVLAEITFSPAMEWKAGLDIHLETWIEKIFSRMGWSISDFPYYNAAALCRAFEGVVEQAGDLEWRGIELFWGRKPS